MLPRPLDTGDSHPSDQTGGYDQEVLSDLRKMYHQYSDGGVLKLTPDQLIAIQAVGVQRQLVDKLHQLAAEVQYFVHLGEEFIEMKKSDS